MSEYAFYWYMNERASVEILEDCDQGRDWPATFPEYMDQYGTEIQKNTGCSDERLHDDWRLGVWQEGFLHALVKYRRGDEDAGVTWWNRDYEQIDLNSNNQ